jgi:glycosyltransferase involved in cell wall biosynthesis
MPENFVPLQGLTIHWITSDRFDTKPDKSTWTEVGDSLGEQGASVNIVTSYRVKPYQPENKRLNMVYLNALDLPLLYRFAFSIVAFLWLVKHADKSDLIVLNPHELWIRPLLTLGGFKRIHLDIRTLPIVGRTIKSKLDNFLFWKVVMRWFAKGCTSYSFITQRLLEAVETEFSVTYKDHVIWQSGVNSASFEKTLQSAKPREEEQKFTLFYHGSLYSRRGVDRVVDAFSLLPQEIKEQSRFLIVGGGHGLDALQAQVKRLGLESFVEFRGLVPYEQIPLHIAEADVCICPLPNYPEWNVSSPLKVLEYMACDRPMILTPIPAHQDVLSGEPFVVWSEGDAVEDLSKAIMQAFETLDSLNEKAKSASQIVRQHWDWNAHGKRLGEYLSNHYINAA